MVSVQETLQPTPPQPTMNENQDRQTEHPPDRRSMDATVCNRNDTLLAVSPQKAKKTRTHTEKRTCTSTSTSQSTGRKRVDGTGIPGIYISCLAQQTARPVRYTLIPFPNGATNGTARKKEEKKNAFPKPLSHSKASINQISLTENRHRPTIKTPKKRRNAYGWYEYEPQTSLSKHQPPADEPNSRKKSTRQNIITHPAPTSSCCCRKHQHRTW